MPVGSLRSIGLVGIIANTLMYQDEVSVKELKDISKVITETRRFLLVNNFSDLDELLGKFCEIIQWKTSAIEYPDKIIEKNKDASLFFTEENIDRNFNNVFDNEYKSALKKTLKKYFDKKRIEKTIENFIPNSGFSF